MKKILIITIILLTSPFKVIIYAQDELVRNSKITPPQVNTPQAASLMKMVDYPVSLHTGLINIEIPIYEIVEGDIRIPISLQYHASGIKPNDPVGRIGAGWSLNTGPTLSRKVNGIEDERIKYGYFDSSWSELDGNRTETIYKMLKREKEFTPDIFYYSLLGKSGKFYYDIETKESYPWKMSVVTNPIEPIKINMIDDGPDYASIFYKKRFNIVDESGIEYKFGNYYNHNWYIDKIISANKKNVIAFAYHNEIGIEPIIRTDHYNVIVEELMADFNYPPSINWQDFPYAYPKVILPMAQSLNNERIIQLGVDINSPECSETPYNSNTYITYSAIVKSPDENLPFALDVPSRVATSAHSNTVKTDRILSSIETTYVIVEFVGIESLNSIIVKDKITKKQLRRIDLYHDNNKIKTLKRVEISDAENQVKEDYSMEYNSLRPPLSFPYNNLGIDHWGYYNGSHNKFLTPINVLKATYLEWVLKSSGGNPNGVISENYDRRIVKICDGNIINAADRTASQDMQKHTMLKSITYPTGRVSKFDYESHMYLHDYSKEKRHNFHYDDSYFDDTEDNSGYLSWSPQIEHAGGLRIKKIEEYDPVSGTTLTKEFKYGKNEDGIGFIKHQIDLEDYGYEFHNMRMYGDRPIMTRVKVYGSHPIPQLTFGNGSTTVYDYVTEYTVNNKTNERIKSVSHFLTPEYSNTIRSGVTTLTGSLENDWHYGHLLDKTDYKSENGNYIPVMKKEYKYTSIKDKYTKAYDTYMNIDIPDDYFETNNKDNSTVGKSVHMESVHLTEFSVPRYKDMEYRLQTGKLLISNETSTSYTSTGNFVTTTDYKYHFNLSGDTSGYPILVESSSQNSDGDVSRKSYTYPFNIQYTNPDEEAARLRLLDNNQITAPMEIREESLRSGVVQSQQITKTKYTIDPISNLPLPLRVVSNTGNNQAEEERIKVISYDMYGNPIHIIKDESIESFYLWGFQGKFLMAEITNTTAANFQAAISGTNISAGDITYNIVEGLRNNAHLNTALISTYNYDPTKGMLSSKNPGGIMTYYEYDSFGRLSTIKDHKSNLLNRYYYKYANEAIKRLKSLSIKYEIPDMNSSNPRLYKFTADLKKEEVQSDIRYSWSIRYPNGQIYNRTDLTSNRLEENFDMSGVYAIYCTAKDLLTGETVNDQIEYLNVDNIITLTNTERKEMQIGSEKYIVLNGIISTAEAASIDVNLNMEVSPQTNYKVILKVGEESFVFESYENKPGFEQSVPITLSAGNTPIQLSFRLNSQMEYYNLNSYFNGNGHNLVVGSFDLSSSSYLKSN